jgi:hypothetical protein
VFKPSSQFIKIIGSKNPGMQIANPSSCDDELSHTDGGQDSYASNSGVDSEIEKREKQAKPVIMAIGSEREWKQTKQNMNREHLAH